MDIRAAEISAILKEQIKNFGPEAEISEVGQVLFRIGVLKPLQVVAEVNEEDIPRIEVGQLVLLRTDLVNSWRNASPADAPNRFVLNVQPDQSQAFQDHLRQAQVQRYDWYPMIRGRLVAINGRAVTGESYTDDRAARLACRTRIGAGREARAVRGSRAGDRAVSCAAR